MNHSLIYVMTDQAALDLIEALTKCCCCLKNGSDTFLNKPSTYRNKTDTYLEILKECFNIDLNAGTDECGICEQCVGRLRDASAFKLQVQRSQAELRERLQRALQVLGEDPEVKTDAEDPEIKSDAKDPEVKPDAEDRTNDDNTQDEVADTKSDEEDGATEDLLEQDIVMWSEDDRPSEDLKEPCYDSHVSARARQQLAMTCSVRLERLHQGRICDCTFSQESSLTTHMEETHTFKAEPQDEAYKCGNCGERFTVDLDLLKHIQMESCLSHIKTEYPNEEAKLKYNRELRKRVTFSRKIKRFMCDVCFKIFGSNYNLQRHINIHTGYKPFVCEICNRSYSDRSALKKHIIIHTKEGKLTNFTKIPGPKPAMGNK